MTRTAVGAPAPRPTVEEMLAAIDELTPDKLAEFQRRFSARWGTLRPHVSVYLNAKPINAIAANSGPPGRGL